MRWSLDIVKLDLKMCKSLKDCKRLREDNGIDDELIWDEKLFEYKNIVDVFFYDKITYSVIAIIPHGDTNIQFTDDFMMYLGKIEPLKFKKTNLDLDEILDKISSSGLESLNGLERRFLRKFSK